MTESVSLAHLHETAYSEIEGDWIKVKQETTDYVAPLSERRENSQTETREGIIVGRGNGTGVYYDSGLGEMMTHSIGPAIYIETPEDTILEVRTDKAANEILNYKNNE